MHSGATYRPTNAFVDRHCLLACFNLFGMYRPTKMEVELAKMNSFEKIKVYEENVTRDIQTLHNYFSACLALFIIQPEHHLITINCMNQGSSKILRWSVLCIAGLQFGKHDKSQPTYLSSWFNLKNYGELHLN